MGHNGANWHHALNVAECREEIVGGPECLPKSRVLPHTLAGSTTIIPGPKVASRVKWAVLKVSNWLTPWR